MAIIKCPECGKDISDMAKTCPACGYPIMDNTHDKKISANRLKKVPNALILKIKNAKEQKNKSFKIAFVGLLIAVIALVVLVLVPHIIIRISAPKNVIEGKPLEIGETVYFGNYYFDSAIKKDPIKWIIIEKKGNKVHLLSKYVIDCQPFNKKEKPVEWADSSLREWLNDDFYSSAFSSGEHLCISTTTVETDSGVATKKTNDKAFILSNDEFLLLSFDVLHTVGSPYAIAKGIDQDFSGETGFWWLRDTNTLENHALAVRVVKSFEHNVNNEGIGVRPSIWVKIR